MIMYSCTHMWCYLLCIRLYVYYTVKRQYLWISTVYNFIILKILIHFVKILKTVQILFLRYFIKTFMRSHLFRSERLFVWLLCLRFYFMYIFNSKLLHQHINKVSKLLIKVLQITRVFLVKNYCFSLQYSIYNRKLIDCLLILN